jgi:hypothetical protein
VPSSFKKRNTVQRKQKNPEIGARVAFEAGAVGQAVSDV